jgi:hypothetical protein
MQGVGILQSESVSLMTRSKPIAEYIAENYWIVMLCDIAKLNQKADFIITYKAKDALYVHKGCDECKIFCPEDRTSFEDSLHE